MTAGQRAVLRPLRFEPPTLLAPAPRADQSDERARQLAAAFADARSDGLRAARDEVDRVIADHDIARRALERAATALTQAAEDLASRDSALTDQLHDAAVRLAVGIAEELIGRELRACDDAVVDAVARAARLLPDRGSVELRVHPDDIAAAVPAAERAGLEHRAEVVADDLVEPGGCVAVAGPLRVDSQIGPALDRVRAALRA